MLQLSGEWAKATIVHCEYHVGEVTVSRRIAPPRNDLIERPARQVMSPYSSASALCHMAFCLPESRLAIQERYPLTEYGEHRWASPEELEVFLQTIRDRGAAELHDEQLLRVAAPLWSSGEQLVGTLGMSLPTRDTDDRVKTGRAMAECIIRTAGRWLEAKSDSKRETPKC
jgi:DNA-binding IclR family transcriptional regulator